MPPQKFMKLMDYSFAWKEISECIAHHDQHIHDLHMSTRDLHVQMKSAHSHGNSNIVSKLSEQLQEVKLQTQTAQRERNQLVEKMENRNTGLRTKIARLSNNAPLQPTPPSEIHFVEFMHLVVTSPVHHTICDKFATHMMNYWHNMAFTSAHGKQLARTRKLEEISGDVLDKMATRSSFHSRNSAVVQMVLKNKDLAREISSFLKHAG